MGEVDGSSEIRVRSYKDGDEVKIVPFLERYMDWPAICSAVPRLDHWRWKFLGNPLGFHLVCVAERLGEVISHSASLPVMMKVGDREVIASQGVDLCTDPSFRGLGLIGRTMEYRNRMKDEHGVVLDFGFPNQAAYHVSMAKQGFRDLGITMRQHRYIIDEKHFFRRMRFGSIKRLGYDSYLMLKRSLSRRVDLGSGITLARETIFGPEHDDLYHRAAADFDLMIAREHPYLNWRYSDPRAGDFVVRAVRQDGRLLGYMVHKEERRDGTSFLNAVDVLVDPRYPDVVALLLVDAIRLAKDLGIETVPCCLPDNHPYARYLQEMGFLSQVLQTGDRPMSIIYHERSEGGRLPDMIDGEDIKAHIMLGDTDWV